MDYRFVDAAAQRTALENRLRALENEHYSNVIALAEAQGQPQPAADDEEGLKTYQDNLKRFQDNLSTIDTAHGVVLGQLAALTEAIATEGEGQEPIPEITNAVTPPKEG